MKSLVRDSGAPLFLKLFWGPGTRAEANGAATCPMRPWHPLSPQVSCHVPYAAVASIQQQSISRSRAACKKGVLGRGFEAFVEMLSL